jgi:photosystem II stability/assembly factor-like uncharacterized protein
MRTPLSSLRRKLVALFSAWPAALRPRLGLFTRRRRAAAGAVVVAAVLVAGCSGFTTEATNILKQADGSYSAQLNFVASCGSGEHCSWYVQYRLAGTSTWTNVPATPQGPWPGPISNVSLSENVTGLTAGAQYEYQVCGNWQPEEPFICVGPDDHTNTTTKFTAATPANWTIQKSYSLASFGAPGLNGIACESTSDCWAVGSGVILATTDGGSTWTKQSVGFVGSRIACASTLDCWAVGSGVLATTDGGTTWTTQSGPGNTSDIACPSTSVCWTVSPSPYIGIDGVFTTTNGGSTWTPQSPASVLDDIACPSTTDCWAVGSGVVVATTNGGSTWSFQGLPSGTSSLNHIACASTSDCWAVGDGVAVATTDGGSTWTTQTLPSGTGILNDIVCASTSECWAVGQNSAASAGVVVATTDGGSTWTTQTLPSGILFLNGIACSSTPECWAVGSTADSVVIVTTA